MGWWFGRKSAPEVRPFVPAWLAGEGEQGGFVRGYAAQLDEVFRRNPVGLRAVRLVAGLAGGLPIFGDDKAVELVKADGLLERSAAALMLHGNAYVRLVTDGHDRPAELHLMRPERVNIATGADGWPNAYLYRAGGQVIRIAKRDPLDRQQVAHLKALNPSDDHYGMGCLDAACPAATVHNRASRWNKALCPVVEGSPAPSPPANPAIGSCYLVAVGATGVWLGEDGAIACFTEGGWRFVAPLDGACLFDRSSGQAMVWRNGNWDIGIVRAQEVHINGLAVLRNRQPGIAEPSGGSVSDAECRVAVASILTALRAHGLIAQ